MSQQLFIIRAEHITPGSFLFYRIFYARPRAVLCAACARDYARFVRETMRGLCVDAFGLGKLLQNTCSCMAFHSAVGCVLYRQRNCLKWRNTTIFLVFQLRITFIC